MGLAAALLTTGCGSMAAAMHGPAGGSGLPATGPMQVDGIGLMQDAVIAKPGLSTAESPPRRDVLHYAMQPGDTFAAVAGQFGLTVNTLLWANHIGDVVDAHAGLELLIPPVNGVLVTVKPGMTVAGLAQQYQVDAQDIIDANLLRDPAHLQPDSLVMLPDGHGPPVLAPTRRNLTGWNRNRDSIVYLGPATGSGGHFPYGQCTWWVAHKRFVPWNGDAWTWWTNARQAGYPEGNLPTAGAIVVAGITAWSPWGHVAYVESVNADGSFVVSEMNYGRWGVVDFRTIRSMAGQDILGFIY